MPVPQLRPEVKENTPKKSDRVAILSKDLTLEQLSWLAADDIPEEAKSFNHEFPGK